MTTIEQLKQMAAELKEMFPGVRPQLSVSSGGDIEVHLYGCRDYAHGTEVLRSIGIGDREKSVFPDASPWCAVKGHVDGVHFVAFCDGIPPSCRIEKVKEKIPKQQTVDTGDFVEIERTRVVCWEAQHAWVVAEQPEGQLEI